MLLMTLIEMFFISRSCRIEPKLKGKNKKQMRLYTWSPKQMCQKSLLLQTIFRFKYVINFEAYFLLHTLSNFIFYVLILLNVLFDFFFFLTQIEVPSDYKRLIVLFFFATYTLLFQLHVLSWKLSKCFHYKYHMISKYWLKLLCTVLIIGKYDLVLLQGVSHWSVFLKLTDR